MERERERENLQLQVGVDEVVEAGEEDTEDPEADKDAGDGGGSPMDVRLEACPAEPACSGKQSRQLHGFYFLLLSFWGAGKMRTESILDLPTRKCQLRISVPPEEWGSDAIQGWVRCRFASVSSHSSVAPKSQSRPLSLAPQ